MNPKDMTEEALFEACITAVRAWPDARTVDEGDRLLKLYKDTKAEILGRLASRLGEADALRKENEELKAQNLLIRGDNADLLANADAYSFNLSNMSASLETLRKENEELRKDKEKLLKDYAELKVNAALLVACDDALESLDADEAKESEASHE